VVKPLPRGNVLSFKTAIDFHFNQRRTILLKSFFCVKHKVSM